MMFLAIFAPFAKIGIAVAGTAVGVPVWAIELTGLLALGAAFLLGHMI